MREPRNSKTGNDSLGIVSSSGALSSPHCTLPRMKNSAPNEQVMALSSCLHLAPLAFCIPVPSWSAGQGSRPFQCLEHVPSWEQTRTELGGIERCATRLRYDRRRPRSGSLGPYPKHLESGTSRRSCFSTAAPGRGGTVL